MARILVVDDEKSIRVTVQVFLEDDGHDVQVAEDAATALELLKKNEFDVILTDIILPKMSGVKLLESIRELSQHAQVIMITGEPNLKTASEALRLGAFDYLAKPITRDVIVKTVNNAARSKAIIDEKVRLEKENLNYQKNLEYLIEERTKALRESEQRYRAVTQTANDAIIVADRKNTIISWNKGASSIFGYDAEEIVGRPITKLIPKRYMDRHTKGLNRAAAGGQHRIIGDTVELNGLHKDGNEFPIELSLSTWETEQGVFYSAIIRDISKRKQAEEALRVSEVRFRTLFETSLDGIVIDQNGILIYANSAYQRMFGIENLQDRLGQSYAAVIAPDDVERVLSISTAREAGEAAPDTYGFTGLRTDGTELPVEVTAAHFEHDGQPATMAILRDITERKLAEDGLQESEKRFRDFFDNAPIGFHIFDANGIIMDINSAELEILGYSREEIVGKKSWADLIIPAQVPQFEDHWKLMNEIGFVRNLEYTLKTKNNELVSVLLNASSRFDETGRLINTRGSVLDISKRKQAEEALKESREFAQNLIDSSLDMIIAVDKRRRITEFNQAAAEIFGYKRDEVIGKHVNMLYADPREGLTIHKKTVRNGQHVQEILNQRKDGQIFPCLLSSSVLRDAEGEVVGIMGVSRDITESKRAEEAVLESEAKYRNLVETSQDLIWSCDTNGCFNYLNPAWENLLGYKLEEMLGKPFADFKLPEVAKRDQKTFKRIIGGSDTFGYETTYLTKSGEERHLIFNARKISSVTNIMLGTSGTAHDITARKQVEMEKEELFEQVLESQAKMESLSGQLVNAQESERRNIARELHDEIGQEIGAILIKLGQLHDSNADRALGEELTIIADMTTSTLENIRHLSRELRPSVLDDLGLVPAIRWLFKRQALLGGEITITIDDAGLPNRLAPKIEIVCYRIVQEVLTNIIKHAHASKINLLLIKEDNYLHIKMQDNGSGFDVDAAIEKATSGETMGLLSMEERASLIGGELEITSQISVGTVIECHIPLNPSEVENE